METVKTISEQGPQGDAIKDVRLSLLEGGQAALELSRAYCFREFLGELVRAVSGKFPDLVALAEKHADDMTDLCLERFITRGDR